METILLLQPKNNIHAQKGEFSLDKGLPPSTVPYKTMWESNFDYCCRGHQFQKNIPEENGVFYSFWLRIVTYTVLEMKEIPASIYQIHKMLTVPFY